MDYRWMLDETMSAGRENLDRPHVNQYDSKEDANAAAELELLKEFGLDQRSVIVDLGAGTGQFTLAAARTVRRVIAVDISIPMLEVLHSKLDASGISNVEVVRAGFLGYDHPGEAPDFVYSRLALHHLPDFWKVLALTRIRSLIKSGGVFRLWDVVYGFDPGEIESRLEAWCSTLDNSGDQGWRRADIEEHIRDEHSTFTWILELMMERCGFRIEHAGYSPDGIFAAYIARAI